MPLRLYSRIFLIILFCVIVAACSSTGSKRSHSSQPKFVVPEVKVSKPVEKEIALGLKLMKEKKYDRAEMIFKDIANKNQNLVSPLLNLALVYIKQGMLIEAESTLKDAIKRNDALPQTYNLLGVVLRNEGRFLEAEQAYKESLDLDENYANAHINIAVLYDLYLLDYEKAKRHYNAFASLVPSQERQVNTWMMDLQQRAQASN